MEKPAVNNTHNNDDYFIASTDNRADLNLPAIPGYSGWECQLLFWTWCPEVGKVPSWFHRKMQTVLLGAKWKKI